MTRSKSSPTSRLAGGSLVALGLIINKWTLEALVVPDGRIESVALNLLLALTQLAIIGLGAGVWFGRWGWLTNVTTALASLAITLLALEGAFRVLDIQGEYPRPRTEELLPGPGGSTERMPRALMPSVTIRTTYASDPRGYFDPGNVIDHVHNSAGWRDVGHTIEKPRSSFRVLGLGDSYLYGRGVRYEDVALTKLGVLLQDDAQGATIETINTGVPGANTAFQRDLLRDRGLAYDPDLVVLFYVLNDVEERYGVPSMMEFFRRYTSIYLTPDSLSKHSYLWSWARQRFKKAYTARQYIRQSIAAFVSDDAKWEQSRRALEEIHRLSTAHGAPLLVVIFPFFHNLAGDYPFQVVHDVVRGYCEDAGIPVLDLRESYREYDGPELWVHPTDQHPNEIAHEIAAHAIYDYLKAHPHLIAGAGERAARAKALGTSIP
jgi:hypothetical protein